MDWYDAFVIPLATFAGGLIAWWFRGRSTAKWEQERAALEARIAEQAKQNSARLEQARKELEAALARQDDKQEHSQETENMAISILREMIKERGIEINELATQISQLREQLARNTEQNKRLRESVLLLAGEIGKDA